MVVLETTLGAIQVEPCPEQAPLSVEQQFVAALIDEVYCTFVRIQQLQRLVERRIQQFVQFEDATDG